MDALTVSHVLLWILVAALALVVVALVRQIGVLHERIAPAGALSLSGGIKAGEQVPALSLRQAARQAGLIEGPIPHRALADSRLTLESFRHYIGRLAPRPPADEVVVPPAE